LATAFADFFAGVAFLAGAFAAGFFVVGVMGLGNVLPGMPA
jgi:hypothetical protein